MSDDISTCCVRQSLRQFHCVDAILICSLVFFVIVTHTYLPNISRFHTNHAEEELRCSKGEMIPFNRCCVSGGPMLIFGKYILSLGLVVVSLLRHCLQSCRVRLCRSTGISFVSGSCDALCWPFCCMVGELPCDFAPDDLWPLDLIQLDINEL